MYGAIKVFPLKPQYGYKAPNFLLTVKLQSHSVIDPIPGPISDVKIWNCVFCYIRDTNSFKSWLCKIVYSKQYDIFITLQIVVELLIKQKTMT